VLDTGPRFSVIPNSPSRRVCAASQRVALLVLFTMSEATESNGAESKGPNKELKTSPSKLKIRLGAEVWTITYYNGL
jgi:hypothetical protein